jgi:hypothetical protein
MQRRGIPLLGLAVSLSAAPANATTCPRGALTGQVTLVRDGDTIVVGSMPIRLTVWLRRRETNRVVARQLRP